MLLTLIKLEFKKGFLFYLILYIFFFFWSLSSFTGYFIFNNFNYFLKNFKSTHNVLILFFKSNSSIINDVFYNDLTSILNTDNYEKISEEELLKELELYNELSGYIDEDLKKYLPIGVRINIKDPSKLQEIKKKLSEIEMKYSVTANLVYEELYYNIKNFELMRYVLIILLIIWNLFYFLFFYFIIKSLNDYLRLYLNTFQLLGGPINKLISIRLILLIIPFIFLLLLSFSFYYILMKFFIISFPFLYPFPDSKSPIEQLYFLSYCLLVSIIYPSFITYILFRKI